MGITLKGGLIAKANLGLSKNLNALMRKVYALRLDSLQEGIGLDMFSAEYLPYEASQTYRAIKAELEYQRSKTIVEAHTQTSRL